MLGNMPVSRVLPYQWYDTPTYICARWMISKIFVAHIASPCWNAAVMSGKREFGRAESARQHGGVRFERRRYRLGWP